MLRASYHSYKLERREAGHEAPSRGDGSALAGTELGAGLEGWQEELVTEKSHGRASAVETAVQRAVGPCSAWGSTEPPGGRTPSWVLPRGWHRGPTPAALSWGRPALTRPLGNLREKPGVSTTGLGLFNVKFLTQRKEGGEGLEGAGAYTSLLV